jgi:RNA polymerase sigma-70 factor (TIGR02960 family)
MDEVLLAGAREGDAEAFSTLTEPYRRELQVHCYRLVGSIAEAEDLVQETLFAAWRGISGFAGRASIRTWLYRIATNRCLNALRDRTHQPAPVAAPTTVPLPEPSRLSDVPWLEPYPDALTGVVEPAPGPEARVENREAISLAFAAAVQTVPPRQRAILVLRDVLGYRGAEVAEMLDTTEDAVASGLKRARSALANRGRSAHPPLPNSPTERRVMDAFVTAFERCDVPALVELLTDDAWFFMPPYLQEYQGREAIAEFFTDLGFMHGTRRYRLVPTRANGQPAFGRYLRDPQAGIAHAHGLTVLTLDGEHISRITAFLGTGTLAHFGLPRTVADTG